MKKKIDKYIHQPDFKEKVLPVISLVKQLVKDIGWPPDLQKDTDSAIEIYVHWKEDFEFLTFQRLEKALTDAVLQKRISRIAKADWYIILHEANSLAKKEVKAKGTRQPSEMERFQSDYNFLQLIWKVINKKEPKVGRGATLANFIQRYRIKIPEGIWNEAKEVHVPKMELSRKDKLLGRGLNVIIKQIVSPFEAACIEYWRLDIDSTKQTFKEVEREIKQGISKQIRLQSA